MKGKREWEQNFETPFERARRSLRGSVDSQWEIDLMKDPIGEQDIEPRDNNLLNKLGLKPGESLWDRMAWRGSWARAFAQKGLRVTASDISAQVVQQLRTRPGKIERIVRWPAEFGSILPREHDWIFTFEPVPIMKKGDQRLIDFARQGLLAKKGLKIVFTPKVFDRRRITEQLRTFAELYGAHVEYKMTEPIESQYGARPLWLITLKTNPDAMKKAKFDLEIESRMRNTSKTKLIPILAKEFGVTRKIVSIGIDRILKGRSIASKEFSLGELIARYS